MQISGNLPTAFRDADRLSVVDAYIALRPKHAIRKAAKGQSVVQESGYADYSMLLLEGWAALSKTMPEGGAQIIDVMLPGDFALIGAEIAPVAAFTVGALTDISYLAIPLEHVNGPEPEHAALRGVLAAMLVTTQARTSELLLRMGRSSGACRVAYALLELYVRLEQIGMARNGRFHLPMTQHRLGEFAGLSNVHVCRTMRRFERDGLIAHPDDHDIYLPDLDRLSALAEIDLARFREEILLRRPQ
ncbi:cAMP-binding domain of CRP or a regulatory subunit of cAMP-dependent protein kinases [Lutimaribacter pacificus]|uniref:cAMP-binding domain of CRP or a regulatory subunit of cAMP-dependent protein kinases n=1 Tax=Lutimaribacter pacificus TaxID=391948 RepID=A0A1H0CFK1_9RHOB|nr:Crp/Fnr family transcriptional regulator [Lutimaribacter pacificus]SDN56632.1 cAMP-binding domain of CRP or a regulatory subunit of cAMP-dependent protein kinases [Lutimaribacter pacificus]SHJ45043.1 cAMP-binding domain of CRP or a regulatory subunit of cAMP-dependent protein kinases [Lutimaribacter pacificus]